jgi:pimeloyl-ACP methyl ester carboxylesterase
MPTTRSGYAPVENGELYYEVTGEGPVLLLIHAGVADHSMWEPQLSG